MKEAFQNIRTSLRQKRSDFKQQKKEDLKWACTELDLQSYGRKLLAVSILLAHLLVFPFLLISGVLVGLLLAALGVLKICHGMFS